MKKLLLLLGACLGALLLMFVLVGCQKSTTENDSVTETKVDTSSESSYSSSDNETTSTDRHDRTVIMLGRSVMYSWFEHWDAADDEVYNKGRFTLEYRELDSPPAITRSVGKIMEDLPAEKKDIVFFKFCFVDFEGEGSANANLEANKKIIEEVYRIVVEEHGARLIIGNALPKVMNDNDIYLVWNHQQYNSWLQDFWKQHSENVTIFNMYKQLASDMGALKSQYAIDEYDSHLNEEGYEVLDKPFWEMMESLY